MGSFKFFDRDISWLSFNERVLIEAAKGTLPLLERFTFLSIYSSNLDEFYRVRIPALMALHKLYEKDSLSAKAVEKHFDALEKVKKIVHDQQEIFGEIFRDLIPRLAEHRIHLNYQQIIPTEINSQVGNYFYSEILAFIQPVYIRPGTNFFPENNQLYLAVTLENDTEGFFIVNIPANKLPRFFTVKSGEAQFICFLDDIMKAHLEIVLPGKAATGCYAFKVTRDAELNLDEEYGGDTAEKIEKQIAKRDFGYATRLLYDLSFPEIELTRFIETLNLQTAMHIGGGPYHNLKDLSKLPIDKAHLKNEPWTPLLMVPHRNMSLFETLMREDILLHTPYQSYDTVLRFFNEASIDPHVTEIHTTMYRVASESKIVHALISAAKNGKKVSVLVELKARFDEANNVKWSKKLKAAGVKVFYSEDHLKVHAKIALVKRKFPETTTYIGLLATGNLHEITARLYTDHILMTSDQAILREIESVFFVFDKKSRFKGKPVFDHLLVAQFNLQQKFIDFIDREINYANQGLPAGIIIKLNNLEERVLIKKLYRASMSGVKIQLIVRGICTLIPGIRGMSENITVTRIVDRYLEHGRVFIFFNGGNHDIFLGSADWMKRNIYRRIEVCFPVYNPSLKKEIRDIIDIQLRDNVQAVRLDDQLRNVPILDNGQRVQSQRLVYDYLVQHHADRTDVKKSLPNSL